MSILDRTGIKTAIQPYYVMSVPVYYKEIFQRDGIAHFYEYKHVDSKSVDADLITCGTAEVTAVPDTCVDIICSVDDDGISAEVWGTPLEKKTVHQMVGREYFGLRFAPGYMPDMLDISMAEVTDNVADFYEVIRDKEAGERMRVCQDPKQWKQIFLETYYKSRAEACGLDQTEGTKNLAEYIKRRLIQTGGQMSAEKLAEETFYSERYVNKVLKTDMGITPKTFARIVKFQNALQMINKNDDLSLTEIAEYTGYYDQSHFIREFKKFADLAPKQYRKAVQHSGYTDRIRILGS